MSTPIPSLDTWTSVFLLAAAQGLFLVMILLQGRRQGRHRSVWLAILIATFSLLLIFNVSYWTNYLSLFPPLGLLYPTLAYLIGPFLLFYLDAWAATPVFKHYRWLHFLPAGLILLLRLPAYLQPLTVLQASMQEQGGVPTALHEWGMSWLASPVFITSHLLLYAAIVYWYTRRIQVQKGPTAVHLSVKRASRMIFLRRWFLIYTLAFVAYYLLVRMSFFRIEHDYLISLVMSVAIYVIGYREYHLGQISGVERSEALPAAKYNSSSLTESATVSIAGKLEDHMHTNYPYRNNELRLNDLADALEIQPHHLSQVINEHFGKTFNQYINEYRIDEAKMLLASDIHRQTYIIEIAYQVGFNNKTTFNHTFKLQTGLSPSQWRNRYRNLPDNLSHHAQDNF